MSEYGKIFWAEVTAHAKAEKSMVWENRQQLIHMI